MKKLIAAIITSLLVFSCEENQRVEKPQTEDVTVTIPSVWRPDLGHYVATNFDPKSCTVVKELPNPYPANGQPDGKANYVPSGGLIEDTWTYYYPTNFTPEQWAAYSYGGYVVSGVGALIQSSSNNYYSICVQYRYLYSDGTLGDRFLVWGGTNLFDPELLEAWIEIPDDQIAYGVGVRGKYDVYNLSVWYRHYDSTTNRLDGTKVKVNAGLQHDGNNTVVYNPTNLSGAGYDDTTDVLQSLGLTANSCGTCYIAADVGRLQ